MKQQVSLYLNRDALWEPFKAQCKIKRGCSANARATELLQRDLDDMLGKDPSPEFSNANYEALKAQLRKVTKDFEDLYERLLGDPSDEHCSHEKKERADCLFGCAEALGVPVENGCFMFSKISDELMGKLTAYKPTQKKDKVTEDEWDLFIQLCEFCRTRQLCRSLSKK